MASLRRVGRWGQLALSSVEKAWCMDLDWCVRNDNAWFDECLFWLHQIQSGQYYCSNNTQHVKPINPKSLSIFQFLNRQEIIFTFLHIYFISHPLNLPNITNRSRSNWMQIKIKVSKFILTDPIRLAVEIKNPEKFYGRQNFVWLQKTKLRRNSLQFPIKPEKFSAKTQRNSPQQNRMGSTWAVSKAQLILSDQKDHQTFTADIVGFELLQF